MRLDEAGNLVLRQTADGVATTDLIFMQQAKDLIRSGLLGMPNPAKELSPTVVQEARDVLAGQEYTELSQELLLSLVPPRVYEVASNPDNVRVMQYRNTNGEISLIVYEQDSPKALTDEAAYAQRQADIAAARAQGKKTLPKAPPGVDRLHAKFETVFNKGKLTFQDRILMSCKLSLLSNTPQTLSVVEFDGESHQ